jgi:deoxyribodipyrimidine photo-lyase
MPEANVLQPGEKAARHRLKRFLRGAIFEYAAQRNQPSLEATSRLSQDFRFGTLSPRKVYAACHETACICTPAERPCE